MIICLDRFVLKFPNFFATGTSTEDWPPPYDRNRRYTLAHEKMQKVEIEVTVPKKAPFCTSLAK